ncbi:MAG: hypothetical protein JHD16_16470, partial [Solirubrobacteraceae bacterium]|nr:hypothetical protein [Solirubrobacteraceae bacterium]
MIKSFSLRRLGVAVAALGAFATFGAPAASATTFGYGDNRPDMFTDARWQALPLKDARRTVDWDIQKYPEKLSQLDGWMTAAATAGANPILAIDRSWSAGQGKKKPSVKQYSALITFLKGRYPNFKTLIPWNEANYILQPTVRNPKLAFQYWQAAKKACKGCTVTSPSLLAGGTGTAKNFIPAFKKLTKGKVKIWAIHVYGDQNRLSDTGLKSLTKQLPGRLWVTETAAWVKFGDSAKWKYDEARAAKVIDYIFKSAKKNKKVDKFIFWQWRGDANPQTTRWDSGVLNFDGTERLG